MGTLCFCWRWLEFERWEKVSRHQSSQALSWLTRVCISCQDHFFGRVKRQGCWKGMGCGIACWVWHAELCPGNLGKDEFKHSSPALNPTCFAPCYITCTSFTVMNHDGEPNVTRLLSPGWSSSLDVVDPGPFQGWMFIKRFTFGYLSPSSLIRVPLPMRRVEPQMLVLIPSSSSYLF